MNGDRFTAWFSTREREGIRDAARELGASQNYVVRLLVRAGLGLPIPGRQGDELPDDERQEAGA